MKWSICVHVTVFLQVRMSIACYYLHCVLIIVFLQEENEIVNICINCIVFL